MSTTSTDAEIMTSHALMADAAVIDKPAASLPIALDAEDIRPKIKLVLKWGIIFLVLGVFSFLAISGKLASTNLFTPGLSL